MTRRDLTSETAQDHFDVAAEARRRGIESYQVRATQAVGDRLVREIVGDAYKGISKSASMIPPSRSSEPLSPVGNGWVDPPSVKPPPGIDIIDRMVEAQSHAERVAAIRQRVENQWIESQLEDKGPRIETEWDPLDRKNMSK